MRAREIAVALAVVLAGVMGVRAETYPSKPITMIVPFPAGGPTDTVARIMSEHMSKTLGQSILVETVTGAGATIGVGRVVSAAPDGYTLSIGNWSSHVGSPAIYPVHWNPVNDLAAIARLPVSSLMIVGKESLPVKDAKELIAWLKAKPEPATAASVGAGSGAHVCGLYFAQKTGTKLQFVFYRGGAPAMQDLLAGTIDTMCAEASQTLAHVTANKMKAFAVMGRTRYAGAARCSDDGRSRHQRDGYFILARAVGAQGHAEGYRRQAQRRGGQGADRSGGAEAGRRARHEHSGQGGAHAKGAA